MSSKYFHLTEFLLSHFPNDVEVSFDELNALLGSLPMSARTYAGWWANTPSAHRHAASWLDAGYVAKPHFSSGRVSFSSVSGVSAPRGHVAAPPQAVRNHSETISRRSISPRSVLAPDCRPEDADRSTRRIGLVGCVKTKQHSTKPAKDLYISPLFRFRRQYVERSCDEWWVLSALHGLVDPEREIAPYDVSLKGASASVRSKWSGTVLEEIVNRIAPEPGCIFEIHAGLDYRSGGLEAGLRALSYRVEVPTAGMSQGVQLSFYSRNL